MITVTKFMVEKTEEDAKYDFNKYGIEYALYAGFSSQEFAENYIETCLKHNRPTDYKEYSIYRVDMILGISSIAATKVK